MAKIVLFFIATVFTQSVALAVSLIVHHLTAPYLVIPLCAALLTGYLCATACKLPHSWRVLNLILPLGIALSSGLTLPPILFFIPLVILLLLYLPALTTRVPFYPTSPGMIQAIVQELPTAAPFKFVDLGCGYGSCLLELAKGAPHGSFTGVELGILPYLVAKIRSLAHRNVSIQFGSIWKVPLNEYEIIYAFLAPPPMAQIWEKVTREAKVPDARSIKLLVNSFPCPAKHQKMVPVRDDRDCVLYVYSNLR
jgi:hypothetical protein